MKDETSLLIFKVSNRLFAFELSNIREVVRIRDFTYVPNAPDYVLGVFNLRGQIVPLIRISRILELENGNVKEAIILIYNDELVGIAVDSVYGVMRIVKSELRPPPTEASEYISGVFEWNNKLVSMLDTEKILRRVEGSEV